MNRLKMRGNRRLSVIATKDHMTRLLRVSVQYSTNKAGGPECYQCLSRVHQGKRAFELSGLLEPPAELVSFDSQSMILKFVLAEAFGKD